MIAFSYITDSLNELDKLYNEAKSKKKVIYHSKLATLELCGWVEDTFDDMVLRHANRKLKVASNIKRDVVRRNNGFQYDYNIRPMLIALLGMITLEKIEKNFEKAGRITILKTSLSNLRESRNKAAHTHLKGATGTYDAPSVIIREFNTISAILYDLDKELRKM